MQQQGRNNEFIQLNRIFKKIELGDKDSDNPFEFDYDSILGNKTDKNIYWKNVLANNIAIVLGEAGSGKTLELKEQCKSLKKNGEHAFFVRLEQLNKKIDEDLLVNIEEWKKTKSKGYFFLDSVDESKLKDVKDFESALTNFKDLIGKQSLANSKIIITSRISEFRYKQDTDLIKSLFNQYGEITIYQIEPLDKDRIIQFANEYDSFSASGFIEEVKTKYLWNLLTRPLDLIDLLNYWLLNKSFGTYKEIIEYNISNKLVDPDSNRQKSLTLEGKKVRNAVERLAACVLLTGESNFLINENHSLEFEALNPKEILNQEWSATEISQLLQLPVFDDAIYGKVRFHHRKMTEYLAACWFNNLLNSNLSISSIEHYFWGEIDGNLFLNNRLKPVIAWLCVGENPWNNKIREKVLSNYPELFLEHGDPSSLDIQDQVTIIKSLSRKYGQTKYYDYFENEALAKFGNPKIGEIINELLFDDLSEEFKLLLIRIAFFANLKTCIPAIFLLLKRTESVSIKNFGVEFIGTLGDESSVQELIKYLKTIELKNTTIAAAVRAFFPNKISIADFIWFISRVSDPVDRFDKVEYDLNQAFHEHLNELGTFTIEALLIGLSDLLLSPPFHREYRPISKKYSWLSQSFELVLNRYLKETTKKNDTILVKGLFICVYLELWGFSRQNIVRNVYLNQEQRELLFDEAYKVLGSKLHYNHLFNKSIINRDVSLDTNWIKKRIKYELDNPQKKLLFEQLLILPNHPIVNSYNKLINKRKAKAIGINVENSLKTVFKSLYYYYYYGRGLVRIKRKISDKYTSKKKNYTYQLLLIRLVFIDRKNCEFQLIRFIKYKETLKYNSNTLIEYSKVEQWAFKIISKRWLVSLKIQDFIDSDHQLRENYSQYNKLTIIEQMLQLNILDISKQDEKKIKLLTVLALYKLNEFASFLNEIIKVKSELVKSTLLPILEDELINGFQESGILKRLPYNPSVSFLFKDELIATLKNNQIKDFFVLKTIFISLQNLQVANELLVNYSINQLKDLINKNSFSEYENELIFFLQYLVFNDSNEFLNLYRQINSGGIIKNLLVKIIGANEVERQYLDSEKPFIEIQTENLIQLYDLVFFEVNPKDDLKHKGGYTPNSRDNAQQFRSYILSELLKRECSLVDEFLIQFKNRPDIEDYKERYTNELINRKERQLSKQKWTVNEVLEFEYYNVKEPTSDHELYYYVLYKIKDIQNDVEAGESSLRNYYRKGDHESELRKFLKQELENRSNSYYKVPQEEEIDNLARPDIRVEKSGINPISIEVKLYENWTFKELEEGLVKQLVGTYLKNDNHRYGLYIVGTHEPIKKKKMPQGGMKSFNEVITELQKKCRVLINNQTVNGLEVIGINFAGVISKKTIDK